MLSAWFLGVSVKDSLVNRIAEESGQDLVEYAALVGGIGVVAFAFLVANPGGITGPLTNLVTKIGDCLNFSKGTCQIGA